MLRQFTDQQLQFILDLNYQNIFSPTNIFKEVCKENQRRKKGNLLKLVCHFDLQSLFFRGIRNKLDSYSEKIFYKIKAFVFIKTRSYMSLICLSFHLCKIKYLQCLLTYKGISRKSILSIVYLVFFKSSVLRFI